MWSIMTSNFIATTAPREQDAHSVWLIIVMAVATAMLRVSMALANAVVLWRVYGHARVVREHLEITRIKPELVVSNGEVLYGFALGHYAIGGAIWLVTTFLAALILYRFLLPAGMRLILGTARSNTPGILAIIWALALFLLVGAVLPVSVAIAVAGVSVLFALSWAWRIGERNWS